jgi:hypothetical protein
MRAIRNCAIPSGARGHPEAVTVQYLRKVSVVIASEKQRWDFAQFRCKFVIRKGDSRSPNSGHDGDTRGQEWYTTATCLAIDSQLGNVNLTGALIASPPPTVRYGP